MARQEGCVCVCVCVCVTEKAGDVFLRRVQGNDTASL